MLFIISISKVRSTSDVIEWLLKFNIDFFRLNLDNLDSYSISIQASNVNGNYFNINKIDEPNINVDSRFIKCVWLRKMTNSFRTKNDLSFKDVPDILLKMAASEERTYFNRSIFNMLYHLPWLNHFESAINDKTQTLLYASEVGLCIPNTIISTSNSALHEFTNNYKNVIIKPIYNVFYLNSKNKLFIPYTNVISKNMINKFPEIIFPNLLQEKIEKQYEIRAFFLDEKFYSMCIFSQNNKNTSVDFRKYDYVKPNRTVSYILPDDIENKLRLLMRKMNINSGSIDLIKSVRNEYVFLEVNPVGQFGMVSYPCNYCLKSKIAECIKK